MSTVVTHGKQNIWVGPILVIYEKEKLPSSFFRFQTKFLGLVVVKKLQVLMGKTFNSNKAVWGFVATLNFFKYSILHL